MRHFLDFEKPIAELRPERSSRATCPWRRPQHRRQVPRARAKADPSVRHTSRNCLPGRSPWRAFLSGLISATTSPPHHRVSRRAPATRLRRGPRHHRRHRPFPRAELSSSSARRARHRSRVRPPFGMGAAEGYRQRAALWSSPSASACRAGLGDTAGAYPSSDAESRGQAEAIARRFEACLRLARPLVAAIIARRLGGAIASPRNTVPDARSWSIRCLARGLPSILWRKRRQYP